MKLRRYLYVFIVSLSCIGVCWTQQAAPAPKTVVIRAGRLLDVKTGRFLLQQEIVIEGDKIKAVRPYDLSPSGEQFIDLTNATVLPGLIDAHTHITMTTNFGYSRLGISVPREALNGARNARVTLEAGFTTIRNVGASGFTDVALRDAINAGDVPGPRMLVSGPALSITGGHCDNNLLPFESHVQSAGVADGVEAVQHKTREIIKYGADLIKICATGGVLSLTDDVDTPQLTQEELNAIVEEAHALRRKTAAHAHGAEGAKRAIRAGIDSIEHGTFLDDEALDMMKQRGTYLVPTLMAVQGLQEQLDKGIYLPPAIALKAHMAIAQIRLTFEKALAKGINIGLGTDAAVYPHGRNPEEFHQMVDLGMKPIDALKAGTSADAELLGIADRVGTLEVNKLADVVAVPGNPVENIRQTERVFFVMKEGVIYKNERAK